MEVALQNKAGLNGGEVHKPQNDGEVNTHQLIAEEMDEMKRDSRACLARKLEQFNTHNHHHLVGTLLGNIPHSRRHLDHSREVARKIEIVDRRHIRRSLHCHSRRRRHRHRQSYSHRWAEY